MSVSKSIQLEVAITNEGGQLTARTIDVESVDELARGHVYVVVPNPDRFFTIVINDYRQPGMGADYMMASAYNAMQGIDAMSEVPHMDDLLMHCIARAFEEGMKYQKDLDNAPPPSTIVQ